MSSYLMKLMATARCGSSVLNRSSSLLGSTYNGARLAQSSPHWMAQSVTGRHMSMQAKFDDAKQKLNTLKEDPGSDVKLKMYALFKQSNVGKVNTKRPSMVDFVGRAKWDAWNTLADMTQEEAQKEYISIVDGLLAAEGDVGEPAAPGEYTCLLVTVNEGLRTITLNRPSKKNAITKEMYLEWIAALKEAGDDPHTVVTAITGAGDFYCSGNDLSNFTNIPPGGEKQLAKESRGYLEEFVNAFIDFPKPLVAVVNGPAIGVSVTTMALCDAIYASDKAFFQTPFTSLGQSAEGCSSYTFPRIMGTGIATEMLLFNKKLTASEAKACGLVTEVYPDSRLQEEVWPRLQQLAKLPKMSLVYGKKLVRDIERDALKKANLAEVERLEERWLSDDCKAAVMAFLTRKK